MTPSPEIPFESTWVPGVGPESDPSASVLVRLMEECLVRLEAGEPIDADALVAAHPELASQVSACLASLQWIHRAVQPGDGVPARLADFRIVREIGRGGMGVVYEAEQVSLQRRVALKVLRLGAVADPEALLRFQREAQTVAALHHTHIVPVFAVGVEQNIHYYAMQLIEGQSLRDLLLSASRPLAESEVVRWGLQVAEALAHAHARNVVHRDVKPSNLILGTDGRIWLTDFGLAKRLDDVTLSLCGALLGTPRYMSPEQASAMTRPVDHRTDIYSLGATLYELATGQPLFDSESPHLVISQILTTEPRRPRDAAPHLSRDFETILLKCLNKDAGQRYQSARELADDLRALDEGRAIRARRATAWERSRRWIHRNRRLLSTAVVTLVATTALLAGGLFWQQQQRHWNQGGLVLKSDHGPLSAELLTSTGEPASDPFTVPNEQPVSIPAGEYQVRVTGAGEFGKTAWITIPRIAPRTATIEIQADDQFERIPLNSVSSSEILDLGSGPDILVLPVSPNGPDNLEPSSNPTLLRRISGRTGKELWSLDVSQKSPALERILTTDALRSEWWSKTVFGWRLTGQPPLRVLQTLPDLDGDAVPDLVWSHLQQMSLFAVSGKTGKPLWWRPAAITEAGLQSRYGDVALGTLPQAGGATRTVIAFVESIADATGVVTSSRLHVLDARDLTGLWVADLPPSAARLEIAAASAAHNGAVTVLSQGSLRVFDLGTGAPWGEPRRLDEPDAGTTTYARPRIVDVDADGLPEVLLTRVEPSSQPLGVHVVPLRPPGLDARTTRPDWFCAFGGDVPLKNYTVEALDLNGDGVLEAILGSERFEFDCRVLDGRSGRELWRQRRRSHFHSGRHGQPVVGTDLDGDGWREVFMVAAEPGEAHSFRETRSTIYCECFSGQTGQSLWWSSKNVDGKINVFLHPFSQRPRWWSRGFRGGTTLLVTAFLEIDFPHVRSHVFGFDALTGELQELALDLADPLPTDFDGDGNEELSVVQWTDPRAHSHDLSHIPGTLRVLQGPRPLAWRRVGQWTPLIDLDGDGRRELWQATHRIGNKVPLISGRTGRILATWDLDSSVRSLIPLREPQLDLDRDERPEILAVHAGTTEMGTEPLSPAVRVGVDLVSSRTGRRVWQGGTIPRPDWGRVNLIERALGRPVVSDLDGDGVCEVIQHSHWFAPEHGPEPARSQLCLTVLDGTTGAVRWHAVLREAAALPTTWRGGADWLRAIQFTDLDGDGVQELIVELAAVPWHDRPARAMQVQVLEGRDGRRRLEFDATFHHPEQGLESVMQVLAVDLDGKEGAELVRLDFHTRGPLKDSRFGGEWRLEVLDGTKGTVRFTRAWEGQVTSHATTDQLPRLRTVGVPGQNELVVSRARFTPYRVQDAGEDWLLSSSREAQPADAAWGLELQQSRTTRSDDRCWSFDLDQDLRQELVSWRTEAGGQCELVASRGLNDSLWRVPMPELKGIAQARLQLADSGRTLIVGTGAETLFVSSDGQIRARVPNRATIEPIEDSLAAAWARGEAAQVTMTTGDLTESLRVFGRDTAPAGLETPMPPFHARGSDPRRIRELPWVRDSIAVAGATGILLLSLAVGLFLVLPLRLLGACRDRRAGRWRTVCVAGMLFLTGVFLSLPWLRLVWQQSISIPAVAGVGLVALGLALSPQVLIPWVRQRRYGRLGMVAALMGLTSAALAGFLLWLDRSQVHPAESYSGNGWAWILLPGGCLGLSLSILGMELGRGLLWLARRRWHRVIPEGGEGR